LDAKAAALLPGIRDAGLVDPLGGHTEPVVRPFVTWLIQNYGETPATIRRFQDRLRWTIELPPVPDFDGEELEERESVDAVVARGEIPFVFVCRLSHNIPTTRWDNHGDLRMHLFARVEYDDLFGRRFTQGFAVRITRVPNVPHITAQTVGGEAYNYRRQQNA
jgi:hypothetical protein